jgi:hypothetical protein
VTETPTEDFHAFICTCNDEGRASAAELRNEVTQRLAAGSEELRAKPVDATNFASAVVLSLEWDYSARISGIGSDQWFGVWAQTHDGSFKTRVECDAVEDGFAATWKTFADRADDRAPTIG